jgi:hypothetical protein
MNGKTMMASTRPDAVGRPREQPADSRYRARVLDQPGLYVPLQHGRQHEQAPDAEYDAGDGGEQLDSHANGPFQHRRAELGQEEGNAEAGRHGDGHRDHRGHHRAVDRRQSAELFGDRIPDLAGDERETERLERRPGTDHKG